MDQSYLRFKKDVLAWKPDVAILGFPLSDLDRSLTVYPFISSPHWGIPFSKPRIVLNDGGLRILNVPTVPPQTMFAMGSISDLPFLKYDYGYRGTSGNGVSGTCPMQSGGCSVISGEIRGPPRKSSFASTRRFYVPSSSLQTNTTLFRSSRSFRVGTIKRLMRGEEREAQVILERLASAVPIVDTTPCVLEVGFPDAYVRDDPHYSPRGNAAVAKCIGKALEPILAELKAKTGSRSELRSSPYLAAAPA